MQPIYGELVAYESFDYNSGLANGSATTAEGFSGNWSVSGSPSISSGLNYSGLSTSHNSLSSTWGRQSVEFAAPLSTGTKWISFLFNMTGNNGGNICGVYLPNGEEEGLFVGYGLSPFSGTQGHLGLGSISTSGTSPQGASPLETSFLGTYGETPYLVVLKIDFDTSGANDTITVYINPSATTSSPDVPATYTHTAFNVRSISGIGFQNYGGGFPIIVDEIRVGDSYQDVVTEGGVVVIPPPVITDLSPTSGLTNGGTVVSITGSNFLDGATVHFGENEGVNVSVNSSNSISATTPASLPGLVSVIVANTNGLSATNLYGFTFEEPPPPPLPAPELVPGSMVLTDSNMNFIWSGSAHSKSVFMTSTNLGSEADWEPVTTNMFGADALATNSYVIDAEDAQRFFGLSQPTAIVLVNPPSALSITPSGSTSAIGLSWTASSSDEVTGYRILYGIDSENLDNSVDVGNVNSTYLFGLTPNETYTIAVIALTEDGQSQQQAVITAQTDTEVTIVNLYNTSTSLEAATQIDAEDALYTYFSDRVRDRHARESQFKAYEHYLTFYWEQRTLRCEIVDTIPKGGNTITLTTRHLAPLTPPYECRQFYLGETTLAQYYDNAPAEYVSQAYNAELGETEYTYRKVISYNPQEGRPLQVGDRMEMEISFFMQPRNGRNNYYGTTFLYIVGEGLVPWEEGPNRDSYPLPEHTWMGGKTTIHHNGSDEPKHAFKQMATNTSPTNGQPFMLGRRLHHTDFGDGTHSEAGNPIFHEHMNKIGTKFINRSCVDCHVNNGRALPPEVGANMFQTVMKVGSDAAGAPHTTLGSVLQPQSTSGSAEGSATIASYTYTNGQYGDGTPYQLRKPNYSFSGTTPAFYSARVAPPLVGLGLLEAISEDDVLELEDPDDADGDGISGRAQMVTDPVTGQARLGRFGHKASNAMLAHHIASALNTDMGVTTSIFPIPDGQSSGGTPELSDEDLDLMMRYVALLGVHARYNYDDPQVLHGESLFHAAGCADCHISEFTTSDYHPLTELRGQTIRPYTDLLLHDMGPGLADNMGSDGAAGSEWRTAHLWSIGHTAGVNEEGEAYLHDGRARTLEEAILWHGGEAEASKELFRNMSASDRDALISFLESL